MSLEFDLVPSDEYCTYITDGTHGTHINQERGKYLLSAKDILDGSVHIKEDSRIISDEDFKKIHKNYKLENYDVLLTVVGTIGRTAIIKDYENNYTFQRSVAIFKTNDKIKSLWLYYYLNSPIGQQIIKSLSKGTTQLILPLKDLRSLEIPVPTNLEDQKKILSILINIDKKIEVNKEINHNLEESIKSIFKYYFVDFIPFIKDLEKGIPKDWESLNLGDVVSEANTGADAIKKAPIVDFDTGIKCVRVGDMTNSRRVDEWAFSEVSEENYKKYQLKKDDIIVTRTATLGLNLLITEDLEAVYNNGLIRIKLDKNKVFPLFIYYYLNTSDYTHYINSIEGETSTRPNMKINYLLKFPILCPPMNIQEDFINIVESLFNLKEKLFNQTVELTKLRDTLLPKLMSGEIDVSKVNCDLE